MDALAQTRLLANLAEFREQREAAKRQREMRPLERTHEQLRRDEMRRRMAECHDDCTDPTCPWFFIHGRRSGEPRGIAIATPVEGTPI